MDDAVSSNQTDTFAIRVSADQTSVIVDVKADAEVSAADIITALRELKLARFDDGVVVEAIEKRENAAISVVVASGTAAVDERPEKIEYRVPLAEGSTLAVAKVEADQVIATLTPAVAGTDGVDVFGRAIPYKKNERPLKLGRNLINVKGQIASTLKGNLRLNGTLLSVEPLLELRGDDGGKGPVSFDGDVVVRGSLNEGRALDITGLLCVGGAIEAIQLKTGGPVIVKGGIIGKQKGRFEAGGDLRCRFVSGGTIIGRANVFVQSEIVSSHIVCAGRVTVAHGPIVGGVVCGNAGIACNILGHPSGIPTIAEAGDGFLCRSVLTALGARIESNRRRIQEVRAKIAPLLKIMKLLTAQQREKATELLYEVEEKEAETKNMEAQMEARTRQLAENAGGEILVEDAIYPGVTASFPGVEAVFTAAFKGPLRLAAHKRETSTEILLIDGVSKSTTVLPSRPIELVDAAKIAVQFLFKAA